MWQWIYRWGSAKWLYQFSQSASNIFLFLSLSALLFGLVTGLFIVPPDYQQGDAFRIIYIHVPAAILSLMIYSIMAFCAFLYSVWRIKMADYVIEISAPIGASVTLLALVTGSIWGKPMWGTWWVWDARLTSEFVLLFIYLGLILLRDALPRQLKSPGVAMMTLVGFIDIPLVHYSVNWWQTLHQGASLTAFAKPKIALVLLYPLIAMIFGFIFHYFMLLFKSLEMKITLEQKRKNGHV